MNLLAFNIERAFSLALYGSGSVPKASEMFERMSHPVVGDLVVEITSVRVDPQRIGVLLELLDEPSYTPDQWAEVLEHERAVIERAKLPGARHDPMGVDAFYVSRGPRWPETTPIPMERSFVIEPLLGDEDRVTWGNARFVAGFVTAHDGPHWEPVVVNRAMLYGEPVS